MGGRSGRGAGDRQAGDRVLPGGVERLVAGERVVAVEGARGRGTVEECVGGARGGRAGVVVRDAGGRDDAACDGAGELAPLVRGLVPRAGAVADGDPDDRLVAVVQDGVDPGGVQRHVLPLLSWSAYGNGPWSPRGRTS